jgi:hypothetical protein
MFSGKPKALAEQRRRLRLAAKRVGGQDNSAPPRNHLKEPLMIRSLSLMLILAVAMPLCADDPKPKQPEKKKPDNPAFVEDFKAGPDVAIQGEYVDTASDEKLAAQVIADGDGQFTIKGFHGGLPGAGWDGKAAKEWKGKLEDGKVKFGDDHGQAVIADGKITVTVGDKTMTLNRTVRKSATEGAKPPEGALVLFDGTNLDQWTKMDGKSPPSWVVEGGYALVRGGDVVSKAKFNGPHTIHVEFNLPFMPKGRGQGRANSGVYVQNRYEVQVLDSFGLKGLNNECGGIYSQIAPKVNMCYPPLQWQTYDIDVTPAKYEGGKKVSNTRVTVKHNGVLIHEDAEVKGPTGGGVAEDESPQGIRLQDHGNPMRFRNIWVVEKKG